MSPLRQLEDEGRREAAIDEVLARGVLYHALASGLRLPHGPDAFSPRGSRAIEAAAALLDASVPSGEALQPAAVHLCEAAAAGADRAATHARLFGHSRGLVCPFETEYGADGAFRQPQELADIAGTYLAFGLGAVEGGDERVDHVACECEFMDFLARKEAFLLASLAASDEAERWREALETARAAARDFLRNHIGRFGRAFAARLTGEDPDGFHGVLGTLLFRFLTFECQRFGLPPGPATLELRPPSLDDTPTACGRPEEPLIQIQTRPRPR